MKHIKGYHKLFENNSNIVDEVNDMLLELNDEGFRCSASEGGELPPAVMSNIPAGYKLVKTHDVMVVSFSKDKPGFDFDDIKEVFYRIKSYLNDNGWTENGHAERERDGRRIAYPSSLEEKLKANTKFRGEMGISGAGRTTLASTLFTKPI